MSVIYAEVWCDSMHTDEILAIQKMEVGAELQFLHSELSMSSVYVLVLYEYRLL